LTFPDYENFPAFSAQLAQISFISVNITLPFYFPELFVRFWYNPAVSAFVHMPEAAVDENNFS
jgi:hypothetical protein